MATASLQKFVLIHGQQNKDAALQDILTAQQTWIYLNEQGTVTQGRPVVYLDIDQLDQIQADAAIYVIENVDTSCTQAKQIFDLYAFLNRCRFANSSVVMTTTLRQQVPPLLLTQNQYNCQVDQFVDADLLHSILA